MPVPSEFGTVSCILLHISLKHITNTGVLITAAANPSPISSKYKKAVLSQGNRAMQRIFAYIQRLFDCLTDNRRDH